jgi:hypothetical protein
MAFLVVVLLNGLVHLLTTVLREPGSTETRLQVLGILAESIGYIIAPALLLALPMAFLLRLYGPISRGLMGLLLGIRVIGLAINLGYAIRDRVMVGSDLDVVMPALERVQQNQPSRAPGDPPLHFSNSPFGQYMAGYFKDMDALHESANKVGQEKENLVKRMESEKVSRSWTIAREKDCAQLKRDTHDMRMRLDKFYDGLRSLPENDPYLRRFKKGAMEELGSSLQQTQMKLIDVSSEQTSVLCEFLGAVHAELDGAKNSAEVHGYVRRIKAMDEEIIRLQKQVTDLQSQSAKPSSSLRIQSVTRQIFGRFSWASGH